MSLYIEQGLGVEASATFRFLTMLGFFLLLALLLPVVGHVTSLGGEVQGQPQQGHKIYTGG